MMRSFESRDDTIVHDEPFYACFLQSTGAPHPLREAILQAQSSQWHIVAQQLRDAGASAVISFEKHIAYHLTAFRDFTWLEDASVFHLVRDPRAMIASFKNKYDDVAPIIDSYRIQKDIYEWGTARGINQPIIDATDIQQNPAVMLEQLCHALSISYSDAMLSWQAGARESDGVWGPHWYDAVITSTGFRPFTEKPIELSPAHEDIAAQCEENYRFFADKRLRLDC